MASFPTSVKNYGADLIDGTDYPQAAHINDLRAEVVAIEAGYLNGTAPLNSSASTMASLSVAGGIKLANAVPAETSLTLYGSSGQLYFNGALVASSANTTLVTLTLSSNGSTAPGAGTIYRDSLISAWALVSVSTAPEIKASFNIAELSTIGTGQYALRFGTNLLSSAYAATVSPVTSSAVDIYATIFNKASSGFSVLTSTATAAAAAASDAVSFAVIVTGA